MSSKNGLQVSQRNSEDFHCCFITVDETWLHYYTSETKVQCKQWPTSGKFTAKMSKDCSLSRESYGDCFLIFLRRTLLKYLKKGETIIDARSAMRY